MSKKNNCSLSLGNDTSNCNIAQVIKYVNDADILKYIPDKLLNKNQIDDYLKKKN